MAKKSTNTKVTLKTGDKGTVVSPAYKHKGVEIQDVWVDHTKTVRVPTKEL